MPIYEFRCDKCRSKSSVFVRSATTLVQERCDQCGSTAMTRVFSRVAVLRSGDDAGFDERSLAGLDESDPRSMAKWMRKMSAEMGEPLDADAEADLERMEAGEMPDDFAEAGDFDDAV